MIEFKDFLKSLNKPFKSVYKTSEKKNTPYKIGI